jgi:hypothetical protein
MWEWSRFKDTGEYGRSPGVWTWGIGKNRPNRRGGVYREICTVLTNDQDAWISVTWSDLEAPPPDPDAATQITPPQEPAEMEMTP